jgi:GNAT superfamily N-acetyltransferase
MTFIVRRARPDEYGDVGQLTLAGFGHLEPDGSLPDGERLALLLDAEGRDQQGVLLVAEGTDGGLLGTASIFPHTVPYARQAREGEAELRLLAVLPAARKQGLGAALLAEGANIATGWGVERLVLDTGQNNLSSQRLYLRLGFEHRPERDVQREPPKVALSVFSLDLPYRPAPAAAPASRRSATSHSRDSTVV